MAIADYFCEDCKKIFEEDVNNKNIICPKCKSKKVKRQWSSSRVGFVWKCKKP